MIFVLMSYCFVVTILRPGSVCKIHSFISEIDLLRVDGLFFQSSDPEGQEREDYDSGHFLTTTGWDPEEAIFFQKQNQGG